MDMLEDTEFKNFISYTNDDKFYIKKIKFFLQNKAHIQKYKKMAINIIKPYSRDNQTNIYANFINKILQEL